ncbi:hypothetical protein BDZ94DRAFT_1327160 [Collybia nuda]|uniref:Uncharacterized protein n=1 Tax=Collybia nuda TaxID=64659 RepID=A0A9P5XSH4_9AGAR|nr:hypothetical protein BDZ94DRAFT_1327160 [Collybia nuda]
MKDPKTGKGYGLCTTANSPTGWMWIRVREATEKEQKIVKDNAPADPAPAPGPPAEILILEVGTYTKNAQGVTLTQQPWYTNLDKQVATLVISTLGSVLIGRIVQRYLVDQVFRTLAATEADELFIAGEEALRQRAIQIVGQGVRKWILRGVYVGSGIGIGLLTIFVWPIVFKDFRLVVKIQNWNKEPWKVDGWYSDNAVVAGGQDWKSIYFPGLNGGFPVELPGGGKELTERVAGLGVYNYTSNSSLLNDLLQGFGIAMNFSSEADPSKGFAFKYCIHAMKDNNLGVKNGKITDLKEYYKGDWAPGGSLGMTSDGVPKVKVNTNMLGGANDQGRTYRVDIIIGED